MNNGAFGENFPYSNFHDLNMDWIIKIAKDFLDQYTHIQETITQGLEDLDEKYTTLEALLQQWYDTHSEDIANQLADALNDLNSWYTEHVAEFDQHVTDKITYFNQQADQKAEETIASIPSDYTALSNKVNNLTSNLLSNIEFDSDVLQNLSTRENIRLTWEDGSYTDNGTTKTDANAKRIGVTSKEYPTVAIILNDNYRIKLFNYVGTTIQPPVYTKNVIIPANQYYKLAVEGNSPISDISAIIDIYCIKDKYALSNIVQKVNENAVDIDRIESCVKNEWVQSKITDFTMYSEKHMAGITNNVISFSTNNSTSVYRMPSDNLTAIKITIETALDASLPLVIVTDSSGNVEYSIFGKSVRDYEITLTPVSGGYVYINLFGYTTVPNTYYDYIYYLNYEKITDAYRTEIQEIANESIKYQHMARKPFDFSGKTGAFTGDSITYGATTGSTDVHGTGDYPTLFCESVGMTCNNRARSGALFTSGINSVTTIPNQVKNISTSYDFLFIAGGVNDWVSGAPISDFTNAVADLCDWLNENRPNIPVIWITPINQAGWEDTHTLNVLGTLDDYRNIITRTVLEKDINARFSILQGYMFNFPTKYDETSFKETMFGDLLHPTALGYKTAYLGGLLNTLC